ncbi:MAG TPA: PilZ domain-containing protein [Allosphingosinicella sp.]|jgi:hypothetical protein
MIKAKMAALDPAGNRVAARRLVNFGARVESLQAGASKDVLVIDLNCHGCKILCDSPLREETTFWLKLPDQEARRTHVVWSTDTEAGCEFATPFTEGQLEASRGRVPLSRTGRSAILGLGQ